MSKIELTDLANLENENTAVAAINSNNAVLEAAIDNTLSRDGDAPNQMLSTLDMNSNPIINLPTPTTLYEPLRVIDRTTLNGSGTIPVSPLPLAGAAKYVLTKNSATNFDASWLPPYPVGGTVGQVLRKNSSADFDTGWYSPSAAGGGGVFINILDYGGDPTDTGYNDVAFTAAWNALSSLGSGCIYFPAGIYKFNAKIIKTLTSVTGYVKILGDGVRATELHFPNVSGGILINQGNFRNSIAMDGFSITTGQVGTDNALTFMSTFVTIPTSAWSSLSNLHISGDDWRSTYGSNKGWARCLWMHVWGQFNVWNVNTFGQNTNGTGGQGTGVIFEGNPATSDYGILYNFSQCSFNNHQYGCIYGDWIQGVSFNQCNFNGGSGGNAVFSQGGGTGLLAQLAITNCQFDYGNSAINMNSPMFNLLISNNIFTVSRNDAIAIRLSPAADFCIIGNALNTGPTYTNTYGIVVETSNTMGTIVGNTFSGFNVGYNLGVGTNNISAIGNAFYVTNIKYVNSGSAQTPGIAETEHTMP